MVPESYVFPKQLISISLQTSEAFGIARVINYEKNADQLVAALVRNLLKVETGVENFHVQDRRTRTLIAPLAEKLGVEIVEDENILQLEVVEEFFVQLSAGTLPPEVISVMIDRLNDEELLKLEPAQRGNMLELADSGLVSDAVQERLHKLFDTPDSPDMPQ